MSPNEIIQANNLEYAHDLIRSITVFGAMTLLQLIFFVRFVFRPHQRTLMLFALMCSSFGALICSSDQMITMVNSAGVFMFAGALLIYLPIKYQKEAKDPFPAPAQGANGPSEEKELILRAQDPLYGREAA